MRIKKEKKPKEKVFPENKSQKEATPILGEAKPEKKITDETKKPTAVSEKLATKKKINEVKVKARFLRVSPRKVRLVIKVVKGMKAQEALEKLQFINKQAAKFVIKLLNSALANAEHNYRLAKGDLYIKKIVANEGPTLHRWQPRAFGRAAEIRKRTTHLELILTSAEGLKQTEKVKAKEKPVKEITPKKEKRKKIKQEKPRKKIEKQKIEKLKELKKEESII